MSIPNQIPDDIWEHVEKVVSEELIKDIKFLIWYASNPLRSGEFARHDEFERIKKKYD